MNSCTFPASGIEPEQIPEMWLAHFQLAYLLSLKKGVGQYTTWIASPSGKLYATRTCIAQTGAVSVCFNDGQKLCEALGLDPVEVLNEITTVRINQNST